MKKINIKKIWGIVFYTAITVLFILIVGDLVADKLTWGARWSSGLPLGGVDNWLNEEGSFYTVPENGFTPGSSYFPGIILLSLLYRLLFGYGAETAIIVTGGIIALLSSVGFAAIVTSNKKRIAILTLVALLIFRKMLLAPHYLLEMHPDIPALMCMTWGIIAMYKCIQKKRIIHYVLATLCFIGAGLFKQNAVAMFLGLGLYTMFTQQLDIKTKVKVLLSEFIAGVCVLIVVFAIDGCWYNCVTVNASHPLLSIKEYITFGISTCKHNKILLGLLAIYIVQRIFDDRKLGLLHNMYSYAALSWLVFCMYGAAKLGANEGNMEAAIIALMPFVLSIFNDSITIVKNYIEKEEIWNKISSLKYLNVRYLTCIIVIGAFCMYPLYHKVRVIKRNINEYYHRLDRQKDFSQWISETYTNKNVAYNTVHYEILNHASIRKTSDFYTIAVWDMGGLISDESIEKIAQDEAWDVIITIDGEDETRWPITFSHFQQLDSIDYPNIGDDNTKVYVRAE